MAPLSTLLGHPWRIASAAIRAVFLGHFFFDHVYAYAALQGPSMLPTFEIANDRVIVSRWYRRGRGIQVGDVVTFDSVVSDQDRAVKRVVGLEGDYVLRDAPGGAGREMLQIPKGHCWVVGDNLEASRDSRLFGPMPMALIKGKIIGKIFPFEERTWIENNVTPPSD